MPASMKEPSRFMLFGGVAVAAGLAVAGGFLFFSNVPNPGAAREQMLATAPHIERSDIDRIIAERNAFAPRPIGVAVAAALPESVSASMAEPSAAQDRAAAALPAPANEGDDMFRRGLYPEALAFWRRDAGEGNRWSAYRLGVEYLDGKPNVVARDVAEGSKWIRLAAERNEPRAQFELGSLYEYGNGVRADLSEAAKWYLKAAERGHVQGQYNIATMLETGEGIAQDKIEALKFYTLAAQGGFSGVTMDVNGNIDANAPDAHQALRAALPARDVEEAEKRAADFKPIQD